MLKTCCIPFFRYHFIMLYYFVDIFAGQITEETIFERFGRTKKNIFPLRTRQQKWFPYILKVPRIPLIVMFKVVTIRYFCQR